MIKEIVRGLPAIILFAIFCGVIAIFGDGIANAETSQPQDDWVVCVSIVDGPISWDHTVESRWIAESYVSALEDSEPLGGHWTIYLNGKEYDEGRWHRYEQ